MEERIKLLPELLVTMNGDKITNSEQWQQKRRPELLNLLQDEVYGKVPVQRPKNLTFQVIKKRGAYHGKAEHKEVEISFTGPGGEGGFQLLLYVPSEVKKPVPAFLLIDIKGQGLNEYENDQTPSYWPAEYIVSRGYAAAVFKANDIDPDFHDGFQNGVHKLFDDPDSQRPHNAWGTIAAWAWGASRVMDYLESDDDIDSGRVAVVGHSRGGKTALWAGAVDQRFAMVVSNNSGSTGAAISRGKKGESVEAINTVFPHWFADNYKKYNGREYEMPFDQHMLLSLIVPRLLYVTSATEDDWADPVSEFLSETLTTPVYNLFNLKGLNVQDFPTPDKPIFGEHAGYHIRTGEHKLTKQDWLHFIDFADRYLKPREV